jgi:predicted secreted protein
MAEILGRLSRIKLGTTDIAKMRTLSVTIGNETIDITSFGDEWAKFARGMQSWTAAISGMMDLDNAQALLFLQAAENGTELTTLRFYMDSTNYYYIDTVEDSDASCFVDSLTITSDNNSVVSFDATITGNGPIARYSP